MKAMFAWLSLLVSLANLFAVASGKPEELPAILKTLMPKVQDLGTVAGFGTEMNIGPAGKLPIKPESELESGKLIAELEQIPPEIKDVEMAKGSILDKDLKTARYVANPEKVLKKLLSDGEGIPEIKQGKIIAGDPAELDVLTLNKRRGDALYIVPECKGKACGDRCGRHGTCIKMGTRVTCSIWVTILGCKRGEPFETTTMTTTTTRTPGKCHECCFRPELPECEYVRVSCDGCRRPATKCPTCCMLNAGLMAPNWCPPTVRPLCHNCRKPTIPQKDIILPKEISGKDAMDIVPDCYGKACGDSCGRHGICKKRGTRAVCDFTFSALGCKIGEPLV